MPQNTWGPHELLELHELLSAETTTAQKLQNAIATVQDAELKSFLTMSLDAKYKRITAMQQLVQNAMQANANT